MIVEHLHRLISPSIDWIYDSDGKLLGKTKLEAAKNIPKEKLRQFYDEYRSDYQADRGIMLGLGSIIAGAGSILTADSIVNTTSALMGGDPHLYSSAVQSGLMGLSFYALLWPMIYFPFDIPRLVKKTVEKRLEEKV